MNEDEVTVEQLPDEVLMFVSDAAGSLAEHTGVPVEKIIFSGMTMHFVVEGKHMTFEIVKAT